MATNEELDSRLRKTEDEAIERRGDLKRYVEDMTTLKAQMVEVVAAAAKFGHIETLEAKIDASHRRQDVMDKTFTPVMIDHNRCQAGKAAELVATAGMNKKIGVLEFQVSTLTKSSDNAAGWWKELTMHIAKTFLPLIIMSAFIMWALHFNGVSLQNTTSNAESDRSKKIEQKLDRIMSDRGMSPPIQTTTP